MRNVKKTLILGVCALACSTLIIGTTGQMMLPEADAASKSTISAKKAKSIALKNAKVSKKKATFTKVKKEYEDGILVYDVEFKTKTAHYDYDINARTGKVVSMSKEIKASKTKKRSAKYISASKAKSIALKKARLKAKQVIFTKIKRDRDDGRVVYEIEFFRGNTEYEVEINAKTGKIIDFDIDFD